MSQTGSRYRLEVPCGFELVTGTSAQTRRTMKRIWEPFSEACERDDAIGIEYDLDKCERIDPGGVLLVMYAGHLMKSRAKTARVSRTGSGRGAFDILLEHLDHLWNREQKGKAAATKYLLRRITDRHSMSREIADWAHHVKRGSGMRPSEVAEWQAQISEVATNTFQHARADEILVAGEAYPNHGYVQLAAIDFGATIPNVLAPIVNVGRSGHDGDIIRQACRKGVTSRCVRQNQGSGLPSLIEMVNRNTGSVQIVSRNGFFHLSNGRQYSFELITQLRGTLVVFNLKV